MDLKRERFQLHVNAALGFTFTRCKSFSERRREKATAARSEQATQIEFVSVLFIYGPLFPGCLLVLFKQQWVEGNYEGSCVHTVVSRRSKD